MATKNPSPKQPQDHKPKKGAVQHIEVRGIGLDIDPGIFDDMRLLHLMNKAQKGDPMAIDDVAQTIFSDEYDSVLDRLEDPDSHRVPAESFAAFISETIAKLSPNS